MPRSIQPGQRRMVVILGRPEVVQVLEAWVYSRHCWTCKSESSGKIIVLMEHELGELMPALSTTCEEQQRNTGP